jgi:hypothetical protein
MTCHDIDSSKRLQHHQYHPNFPHVFPGFCTSVGAAVTSPLAACGARAACEAMGGSTIDGAAAGDCATDSTDSTAAGEAATSMTLRTLSAFHRFQMFEGIGIHGIQVQQISTSQGRNIMKHLLCCFSIVDS